MKGIDRDTTRIVRSWLEAGATQLPDDLLNAVLDQLPDHHQRQSWWLTRRFPQMNTAMRVVLAGVAALAVVASGAYFLSRLNVAAPAATPTPTASASSSGISGGTTPAYASGWSAEVRAGLDTARAATDKYRDIEVARSDGYALAFGCVNWIGSGWVNVDLLADPAINLDAPELLIYDGDHVLAGIDYMVYLEDEPTRPDLMGQPMQGPQIVPGSPLVKENFWEMRVWLYEENPDGMFSPSNRSVSC